MATLAQIRNGVDTWLTNHWPAFTNFQDNFHQTHGRYWQGLRTASVIPADGTATAPDQLNVKPSYEVETWADLGWLDPTMAFALQCDAYDGPQGQGYVAHCFVTVQGVTYVRSQNVGPETWRTAGWQQVPTGPGG